MVLYGFYIAFLYLRDRTYLESGRAGAEGECPGCHWDTAEAVLLWKKAAEDLEMRNAWEQA